MQQPSFTGVILAGGASRRMGTDKGKMRLGGKSMLAIMRQKLLDAGATNIVVLGLADEKDGIADRHPGQGPAYAAAHYLDQQPIGSKHLFVPVDMPALDARLLRALGRQNYWARYGDFNLPFLGLSDGIKLPLPRRLYDLLTIKMAKRLPLPKGYHPSFVNLNSPDDCVAYTGRFPGHKTHAISAERTC